MRRVMTTMMFFLVALPVLAQGPGPAAVGARPVTVEIGAAAKPRPKPSEGARAALATARELEGRVKGSEGQVRSAALQAAAAAYDKVAVDFAGEPPVAAQAAFAAGDLWRRHGSPALAEQGFLTAARLDAQRFGQRGLLEAAEVQRRGKRNDEALATYAQSIAADPGTPRAQEARLWQGRLLHSLGRLDESIATFRGALEAAQKPKQVIDAANQLSKVLIQKGDLDSAESALSHADEVVQAAIAADATQAERLQKSLDGMSARKSLGRARDKQSGAAKQAKDIEQVQNRGSGRD